MFKPIRGSTALVVFEVLEKIELLNRWSRSHMKRVDSCCIAKNSYWSLVLLLYSLVLECWRDNLPDFAGRLQFESCEPKQ